jgi:hypothetical protein
MNTTITPLRRVGATLAIAGFAALGSVAIAPAASAAPASERSAQAVHSTGANGPDAWVVLEHGRAPVFFCDEAKPNKQKNICLPGAYGGDRF